MEFVVQVALLFAQGRWCNQLITFGAQRCDGIEQAWKSLICCTHMSAAAYITSNVGVDHSALLVTCALRHCADASQAESDWLAS